MKKVTALLAAAVAAACFAGPAAAQDKYPSKPTRIIVPYAPGGATDIVSRILGDQLKEIFKQAFVTENKPGAFGILAIEEMARSKPDGYSLMIGNVTTNAITPILHAKKFSIDYAKDVIPVARLVDIPAFVVVSKDLPVKTMQEFVDYAKKNKGKVRYGHVGVGSYPQYDMEVLAKRAGIELVGIPNKAGASGILKDMATGDIQASFLNVASSAALIKAGQIRPIAVVNPTRLPSYPDVPTMAEVGFPGVGTLAWQAMFAPAGTPKDVLDALIKGIVEALDKPSTKEAFSKQYFNIVPTKSPEEAKKWLADEMANWKKITEEVKVDLAE
ncbi:MAG TPA: tripartite tricarboxylate transporter substrate binding protein [Xanthobacteraceae bacterium]|nr:tripartite tricarboxylate transporter substrate binding protein [Xanthobacteraceae bacterium]